MQHDLDDHSRDQQDRSDARPGRRGEGGNRTHARHRCRRRSLAAARRRALNCEAVLLKPCSSACRRRKAIRKPCCRRWCSTRLRRVPRRSHVRADHERHCSERARRSSSCRPAPRTKSSRSANSLRGALVARLAAGQVGLPHLQHQVARQCSHRRHHYGGRGEPAPAVAGYQSRSGWSSAASIRPTARTSSNCARRSTSSHQRPSFEFEPESSDALGFGFRCGFLGLLHMEIVQQRLEQDSDIDLVQTAPNVTYEITTVSGEELRGPHAAAGARPGEIERFRQPIVRVNFVLPTEYIGPIMKLCTDRRGEYVRHRVPLADPRDGHVRPGPRRRDLRHARQAQKPPAATARWTTMFRATARATSCGSTSW